MVLFSPLANKGSYEKHLELLHKHRRNPDGPNQLYRYSLSNMQETGRWILTACPSQQKWSHHHRHAHVNSEMTRYYVVKLIYTGPLF